MAAWAKKTSRESTPPPEQPTTQLGQEQQYAVGVAIVVIFVFVLLAIIGCPTSKSLESVRALGVAAGREDGRRAGEAKCFQTAFDEAEETAYSATLAELRLSGGAPRSLLCCLAAR
jgi:hypothetical protein